MNKRDLERFGADGKTDGVTIRDSIGREQLTKLWEDNKRFVYKMAGRYTDYAEFDDLVQEGYIGIYLAALHFDESAGTKFLTYAAFWIKQRMRRHINNCRSVVRIPSHVMENIRKYKKFQSDYQKQFGRKLTEDEMRVLMGKSQTEYNNMQQAAGMEQIASISSPISNDEDATLEDMIGDKGIEDVTVERVNRESIERDVRSVLNQLSEWEQKVIRMRYFEGLPMEMVAELEGISIQDVRRGQEKALRRLRQSKYRKALMPYMYSDQ